MDNYKKLIYIVSLLLFTLSVIIYANNVFNENQEDDYISVENTDFFDINSFMDSMFHYYTVNNETESPDFKTNEIVALYLIDSSECNPCINEMMSFIEYFEDKSFDNKPINQSIVIADTSDVRALRFIRTSDFIRNDKLQNNIFYGYDNDLLPKLGEFGQYGIQNRQLILIDEQSKNIFYRTYLQKGQVTSIEVKERIFQEMEASYDVLINSI